MKILFENNTEEAEIFLSLFEDDIEKKIAKCLFIDGMTNEETAEVVCYSTSSISNWKMKILKDCVKILVGKKVSNKF